MPSKREQVLQALFQALQGVPGPRVLRGGVLPERIPPGLLILRDGNPGAPGITLSPLRYHYEHRAEVEVIVESSVSKEQNAALDDLLQAIGAALALDRTLGGLCDWMEAEAPESVDLPVEGGTGLKAAVIPVVLHYASADPLA